jgi:hypothetical protein
MIANNLIDRDDDRKRSILTIDARTIDSGRDDDREQARRSTATKIAQTQ